MLTFATYTKKTILVIKNNFFFIDMKLCKSVDNINMYSQTQIHNFLELLNAIFYFPKLAGSMEPVRQNDAPHGPHPLSNKKKQLEVLIITFRSLFACLWVMHGSKPKLANS
jgi:hypothetical protein